jgi:hypothetical protein
MMAVGADHAEINDQTLDIALGAGAAGLKQKVGLSFKCNNLPNLDRGSKTDAFCVLYNLKSNGQKERLGMTEMIADSLNPEFVTEILTDYMFEA